MEPPVQYVRTSDGVNIAYAAMGQGPPLVWAPHTNISHAQLEWPVFWSGFGEVFRQRTFVRYDSRGQGLSDRDGADFSFDSLRFDLEAVVGRLGVERFDLGGTARGGMVAAAYAARHPERVRRLILADSFARGSDFLAMPQIAALAALVGRDWEMYVETLAGVNFGWRHEHVQDYVTLVRESVSQEALVRMYDAMSQYDVTSILPDIVAPTLIVRHGGTTNLSVDMVRELAAAVPHARLVVLPGKFGDSDDQFGQIVADFLSEDAAMQLPAGTAVILFADIVDSTALTEQLGDAPFRERARALDSALRSAIRAEEGTAIEGKLLGDGVLAVFISARQAIACASRCQELGRGAGLLLHVGVHAGDVIREEGNVFGGAVNIAARIAAEAAAGEVLVSQTVRDLARTSAGVAFEDRGEHELKGVGEPQRLFAVKWDQA